MAGIITISPFFNGNVLPDMVTSTSPSNAWVAAVKGGDPDIYRLTLTFDVLNKAREVVFLVSGIGKAPIVKTVIEVGRPHLPAQMIDPVNGKLIWVLDREAASSLSGR